MGRCQMKNPRSSHDLTLDSTPGELAVAAASGGAEGGGAGGGSLWACRRFLWFDNILVDLENGVVTYSFTEADYTKCAFVIVK